MKKTKISSNTLDIKINFLSLLKFVMPTIIMMFFLSLYTIVDGIFVARYIGENAFSAVNIVFPISSVVIAIGTMFGSGGVAIISKKLGENNENLARETLTFIILSSVVAILIFCGFSLGFLNNLIYFLGASDKLFNYCYEYAFFIIIFLPFNILQLQFQFYFVANGKPNLGLIAIILGGITNIFLDWLFLDILNTGIKGAAIATGISYLIPAIFGIFYFLFNKKNKLYFVRLRFHWKILFSSIINGSSEMVNNLSVSVTTFLYNLIMIKLLGEDGVAAITIILYLDILFVAISIGYAMGIAPLISYNHGSNEIAKIKKIYLTSLVFCLLTGFITTLTTILASNHLVSIFVNKSSNVFSIATTGLVIFAISYIFKGANIFASAFFTAFNNGLISALISGMRSLIFLISSIILFAYLFREQGVWMAVPISEAITLFFSMLFLFFYRKKYRYFLSKKYQLKLDNEIQEK